MRVEPSPTARILRRLSRWGFVEQASPPSLVICRVLVATAIEEGGVS